MSLFTQNPWLEHHTKAWREWTLLQDLWYEIGEKGSGRWIRVPKGFLTDGASTPRVIWAFLPSTGRYLQAAILHDYLYKVLQAGLTFPEVRSRGEADREFRLASLACGVSPAVAWILWLGVRLGGWVYFLGAKKPSGAVVPSEVPPEAAARAPEASV